MTSGNIIPHMQEGTVNVSDNSELVGATNETNSLMKGMIAQNQQLMKKLISTTSDIGTLN